MPKINLSLIEQQITSNTDITLIQDSLKPLQTTNNSILYTAINKNTGEQILIKKIISKDFDLQWKSLQRVTEKIEQANCKVPKLLALSKDQQIIYMEYIEGESLKDLLLGRHSSQKRKQYVIEAARWLACYHQIFATENNAFDPGPKLENINRLYTKYQNSFNATKTIDQAIEWLAQSAQKVSSKSTYWGGYHGDFKPENLINSFDSTYGIDFILVDSSYQLMDLAQFSNHILYLCLNLFGYRIYFNRKKLIDVFLVEYQKQRGNFSIELLNWLRLEHLLRYYFEEKHRRSLSANIQATFIHREIFQLLSISREIV